MKRKSAFTLLEMLIVVLVILVLIAIAYPIYTKSILKSRAAEAVNLLEMVRNKQTQHFARTGKFSETFAALGKLTTRTNEEIMPGSAGQGIDFISLNNYDITMNAENACATARYSRGGNTFAFSMGFETPGLGCTGGICRSFGNVVGTADEVCQCRVIPCGEAEIFNQDRCLCEQTTCKNSERPASEEPCYESSGSEIKGGGGGQGQFCGNRTREVWCNEETKKWEHKEWGPCPTCEPCNGLKCPDLFSLDLSQCKCICKLTQADCYSHQVLDPGTCTCICPGGIECGCPPELPVWNGYECLPCPPPGTVPMPAVCAPCPPPMIKEGTQCVCPPGMGLSGKKCLCNDPGYVLWGGGKDGGTLPSPFYGSGGSSGGLEQGGSGGSGGTCVHCVNYLGFDSFWAVKPGTGDPHTFNTYACQCNGTGTNFSIKNPPQVPIGSCGCSNPDMEPGLGGNCVCKAPKTLQIGNNCFCPAGSIQTGGGGGKIDDLGGVVVGGGTNPPGGGGLTCTTCAAMGFEQYVFDPATGTTVCRCAQGAIEVNGVCKKCKEDLGYQGYEYNPTTKITTLCKCNGGFTFQAGEPLDGPAPGTKCRCTKPDQTPNSNWTQCICPPPTVMINGVCGCAQGSTMVNGQCKTCAEQGYNSYDYNPTTGITTCKCAVGSMFVNGSCKTCQEQGFPNSYTYTTGLSAGTTVCYCNPGYVIVDGVCKHCVNELYYQWSDNTAMPYNGPVCKCKTGFSYNAGATPAGVPMPPGTKCRCTDPNMEPNSGWTACVCKYGMQLIGGVCKCQEGWTVVNGQCKSCADQGFDAWDYNPTTGVSVCKCAVGSTFVNGQCKTCLAQGYPQYYVDASGNTICRCAEGYEMVNGVCKHCKNDLYYQDWSYNATTKVTSCRCWPQTNGGSNAWAYGPTNTPLGPAPGTRCRCVHSTTMEPNAAWTQCVCKTGMVLHPTGGYGCVCPEGSTYINNQCVPCVNQGKGYTQWSYNATNGVTVCRCPSGSIEINGTCQRCKEDLYYQSFDYDSTSKLTTCKCYTGFTYNASATPTGSPLTKCQCTNPDMQPSGSVCVCKQPKIVECNGNCYCPDGQTLVGNECKTCTGVWPTGQGYDTYTKSGCTTTCKCNTGYVYNATDHKCKISCSGDTEPNAAGNACECKAPKTNQIGNNCFCPEGSTYNSDNNTCVPCTAQGKGYTQWVYANGITTCRCAEGAIESGGTCKTCVGQLYYQIYSYNPTTKVTTCACLTGFSASGPGTGPTYPNGKCICSNSDMVPNQAGTACVCGTAKPVPCGSGCIACAAGSVLDGGTCKPCNQPKPTGMGYQSHTFTNCVTTCICTTSGYQHNGTTCVLSSCDGQLVPINGECACAPPKTNKIGNNCYCPAGSTFIDNQCKTCESQGYNTYSYSNGTTTCKCLDGYMYIGGQCKLCTSLGYNTYTGNTCKCYDDYEYSGSTPGTGTCVCKYAGMVPNGSVCICSGPSGKTKRINNACFCENAHVEVGGVCKHCVTQLGYHTYANNTPSMGINTCQCYTGATHNGSQCVCNNPDQTVQGTACACPSTKPTNYSTCCGCPTDYGWNGSTCGACLGGKKPIYQIGTCPGLKECNCPAEFPMWYNNSICICPTSGCSWAGNCVDPSRPGACTLCS